MNECFSLFSAFLKHGAACSLGRVPGTPGSPGLALFTCTISASSSPFPQPDSCAQQESRPLPVAFPAASLPQGQPGEAGAA